MCFLISMHSVHTRSPNHPQCVFLFQCTQFTQSLSSPTVCFLISMHSVHTRSPKHPKCAPKVCFLISVHSVHTRSPNHPQCVFLFQCTQFTQSLPITHSVFPYFNALSSHKVSQLLTVTFLFSLHLVQITSPNY